jgi:hypothetical protein
MQLAARLQVLADATTQVSDQLSMQHFSHVGQGRRAVAT